MADPSSLSFQLDFGVFIMGPHLRNTSQADSAKSQDQSWLMPISFSFGAVSFCSYIYCTGPSILLLKYIGDFVFELARLVDNYQGMAYQYTGYDCP
jgi:hypothetical protein